MNPSADASRIEADLLALLQGQLDDDGMARLEAFLASSPDAGDQLGRALAQWLALRSATRRAMRQDCPPLPDSLRQSIETLLATAAQEQPAAAAQAAPMPPATSSPRHRWRLVDTAAWAMAAMVLLAVGAGLWTGHLAYQPMPGNQADMPMLAMGDKPRQPSQQSDVQFALHQAGPPVAYAQLSDDRIMAFGKRHNTCSRKLEQLYQSSEFPQEVGKMPQAIAGCLGKKPRGSLDLSRAGYQFTQAGRCHVPGQPSVHLVYKAKSANDDSVSLWVVSNTGQPQIEEGVLYQGDPADSPHPIFFWRKGDLVYYLVGNAFDHTRKAAADLLIASK